VVKDSINHTFELMGKEQGLEVPLHRPSLDAQTRRRRRARWPSAQSKGLDEGTCFADRDRGDVPTSGQ